jgi:hypothetical protein
MPPYPAVILLILIHSQKNGFLGWKLSELHVLHVLVSSDIVGPTDA